MITMPISKFKTHALKTLDQISKGQKSIIISKRGKPIAEIKPYYNPDDQAIPGALSETILFEEDIISPLGEDMWSITQ